MFLRYTHLGVGHPVALRRIVRDCFAPGESMTPEKSEAMDVDEGGSNGKDYKEDDGSDDEQMDLDDDQIGESESEDECDEVGEEELGDDEDPDGSEFDGEIEEMFDNLSF